MQRVDQISSDRLPLLGPLIAKRIHDEKQSGSITSLAICNHLSFFANGIDSIPVYLNRAPGVGDTQATSGPFHDQLHCLFGQLEDLISEEILQTGFASGAGDVPVAVPSLAFRFPKLRALLESASGDSEDQTLSSLIKLPDTVEKAKEAYRIISEFNDGNHERARSMYPQDESSVARRSIKAAPVSIEAKKFSPGHLSGLCTALRKNIETSGCSNHRAKVQVRHPDGAPGIENGSHHRIFVSGCPPRIWWKEMTCRSALSSPEGPSLASFCRVIRNSFEVAKPVNILVHEDKIFRDYEATREYVYRKEPVLTLAAFLGCVSRPLRRFHKIALAINLSQTLYGMYDVDMDDTWTADNVYFLCQRPPKGSTHKVEVTEAYNPYVEYSLSRRPKHVAKEHSTMTFPLLIAFGKLLLELALGRRLTSDELNICPSSDVASLRHILWEEDEELVDKVPPGYYESIMICLTTINYDDDDGYGYPEDKENDGTRPDSESQIRGVLLRIIEILEEERRNFRGPKANKKTAWEHLDFDMRLPVSIEEAARTILAIDRRSSETARAAPQVTSFSSSGGPGYLSNGTGRAPEELDSKVRSANRFMSFAQDCYERHIDGLPKRQRIKIAVLDTGLDQANDFIQGQCDARKHDVEENSSPFKELRSFVDESHMDNCGHGTNVAALILGVAPEADLYIGKISNGNEKPGHNQILQAIEWAHQCNVDIISMSFGITEEDYEIERAVGKAENDGVIFFAAASNDGGNRGRYFPARMDKVLCIHSTDGDGNPSSFNPSPKENRDNFSTLGEGIKSVFGDNNYLSGTSYATPVAAGFAANALLYIRNCTELQPKYQTRAFTRVGMRRILVAMSEKRGMYNYITPWRKVWTEDTDSTTRDVATRIREALNSDL